MYLAYALAYVNSIAHFAIAFSLTKHLETASLRVLLAYAAGKTRAADCF